MNLSRARGFGRARASSGSLDAFILSLFAAGEQGAWLDPSDFSTLFQDSAGTTPVTAVGQPVGRMLDKSGRGNHVVQATATSRPVLQQDGSGRYYLACDGVDDGMATAGNVDFSGTDKMTVCVGVRKLSDVGRAIVIELGNAAASGSMHLEAPANAASANYQFFSSGSLPQAATASAFAAPNTSIVTGIGDISGDLAKIRINGADIATTAADQGTGNYRSDTLYLFRRGGTQFPFNGNFYGGIIRGALSNAQQIAQMEAWANSKTGAF